MKNPPILAAIALLASSGLASAATILYATDFSTPTYSDGALIGQDNWVLTNSTTNPLSVTSSATDGVVVLGTSGQDVRRGFTESAVTSGSVFLKAEITVSSAQATGDYFLHLGDNGTSNFYARTYIRSSGTGFVMALGTSSGAPTYGTIELAFNSPLTLLIRYDFVAGAGNDTGALFVNPTTEDGSGDTAYIAASTVGTDAATISSVSLRQGTAANAPGVTVDSISVFVPEPGVAMLGALGVLGLLRRRRL